MVEWIENVERVCELCEITKTEQILPLRLKGRALAVNRQLNKEQRTDSEQIKCALLTAFGTDHFMDYDQFQMQHVHPGKTVDVFLAELKKLAVLITALPEE